MKLFQKGDNKLYIYFFFIKLASLKSLHACLLAYEVLLPYPYDNLFRLWSELEPLTTRPAMPLSVYLDTKTVHCQRRFNYITNLQIVMDLLTSLERGGGGGWLAYIQTL